MQKIWQGMRVSLSRIASSSNDDTIGNSSGVTQVNEHQFDQQIIDRRCCGSGGKNRACWEVTLLVIALG
jgi:hypothetical protein